MKTRNKLTRLLTVLFLLPAVTTLAQAQSPSKEAVALMKSYQEAYNKGNLPALLTLYADNVGWVNRDGSVTPGTRADVEADYVRDFGETVGSYMDFTVVGTETMADGKMKINTTVNGYDFDRKTGTKLQPTAGTYAVVVAKEGEQWKIGQVQWAMNQIALEVRDFLKKFQDALNREDAAAVKGMLAADVVRKEADGSTTKGADQILDIYTKRFADADINNLVTLSRVTPQFDGSVLVTGTYRQNGRSATGNRITTEGAFKNTLVKENGQWKTREQNFGNLVKMMVHHKVTDYAAWKKSFDRFYNERSMAGELTAEVGTAQDDPTMVYVISEWASPDAARAFFARPELAANMQKAGVVGKPTMMILNKK